MTSYHCYCVLFIVNEPLRPSLCSEEGLYRGRNSKRWGSLGAVIEAAYTDMIPNCSLMESYVCCSYMLLTKLFVVMWIDALRVKKKEIIGLRKM